MKSENPKIIFRILCWYTFLAASLILILTSETAVFLFLGKHFVVKAEYGYLRNRSTDDARSYENNRFWVLLSAFTGRVDPRERETAVRGFGMSSGTRRR